MIRPDNYELKIGDIAPAKDDHAGLIYAGIPPGDTSPLWVSQYAPTLKNRFDAAAWTAGQNGRLPTRQEGKYLNSIKEQGAFGALFNRSGKLPDGYMWLADTSNYGTGACGWCQDLSDGTQVDNCPRDLELPVLCVRR